MTARTYRLPILSLLNDGAGDYVLEEPDGSYNSGMKTLRSFCASDFQRVTGLKLRKRQRVKVRITILVLR